MIAKVLSVGDGENILSSYKRPLHQEFMIRTVADGQKGFKLTERKKGRHATYGLLEIYSKPGMGDVRNIYLPTGF